MLGYNDVFVMSIGSKLPLEHTKYDRNFSKTNLELINSTLSDCVGHSALYFYNDGKKYAAPKIVTIKKVFSYGVLITYKCYDPIGEPRQNLDILVSNSEIYCRDAKLCILDVI